jgi:ABC-2 type transport system permease protein
MLDVPSRAVDGRAADGRAVSTTSAIPLVFRKELRQMWRDARLAVAVLASILIVAAMALGGLRHHHSAQEERAHASEVERKRWLGLGDFGPHGAAHHGVYAFRPDSPLASFDPGVAQYLGVSVWLEAHKQNAFVHRPMQDAAPAKRFGDATPALALQILGPLLIILLGFDAFAGERDSGTLRQLLAAGVSGRSLLLGKAAAVGGVALVLLSPALIVTGTASLLAGEAADWTRFSLLAMAYLAYLATFLGMTLAVSAYARSARAALAILLSIWVVDCFVLPRAGVEIADAARPLPASAEWEAAMRADLSDGHAAASEQQVKRELLAQYGVESEDALPVNWRAVMLQRGEERNYLAFDTHFARLADGMRAQDRIYQWGGLLAPSLALQSLSMGLAASDSEHHWRFVRAAEDHRRLIQKTVNSELLLHPEKEWGEYKAGPELWARVPEFHYLSPRFGEVAAIYLPAFLALAVWLTLSWTAALRAARSARP